KRKNSSSAGPSTPTLAARSTCSSLPGACRAVTIPGSSSRAVPTSRRHGRWYMATSMELTEGCRRQNACHLNSAKRRRGVKNVGLGEMGQEAVSQPLQGTPSVAFRQAGERHRGHSLLLTNTQAPARKAGACKSPADGPGGVSTAAVPREWVDDFNRPRRDALAEDALEHRTVDAVDAGHAVRGHQHVDSTLGAEPPAPAAAVGDGGGARSPAFGGGQGVLAGKVELDIRTVDRRRR